MRRTKPAIVVWAISVALLAAACGDDETAATSTTTSTVPSTSPPVTQTTVAAGLVVASEGDRGPVPRALQFLLVCNGYTQTVVEGRDEELVPDGVYGKITTGVIEEAQRDLGLNRSGSSVDADLYEQLASTCENTRSVYLRETTLEVEAGGYASPDLPDAWTFFAQSGQRVVITPDRSPIRMGLTDPNGEVIVPVAPTDSLSADLPIGGTYRVTVEADAPLTYEVTVWLPPHHSALLLQSTGLDVVDFGDGPGEVTRLLSAVFGEPTLESAWFEANEQCIRWRRVVWGDDEFSAYFTDAGRDAADRRTFADDGVEHFAGWKMAVPPSGEPTLPALETPSGLMIGDSAERVEEVYGDNASIDETDISIVDGIIIGELTAPDGTVAWLSSGAELCGRPAADADEDDGDS